MSRSFGQHYVITAGIEAANSDWVGVLNCDLQDHRKHLASTWILLEQVQFSHGQGLGNSAKYMVNCPTFKANTRIEEWK
ncbi:MAG: hypothetical protein JJ921_17905 [Pseudomonadales bacterium]|nr:hypothetical protein [Pseudomonadales bacterium]MBO7007462.1 hypothetical protein [Pseudomonadales bacterium]